MGMTYTAKLINGTERNVASFSYDRALLFADLAHLLEKYVKLPCGISYNEGLDDMVVDAALFVAFFDEFWSWGWLGDSESSFVYGWAEWAAGIVENITLQPTTWIDRRGKPLKVQRYILDDEAEKTLTRLKAEGVSVIKKHRL